MLDDRSCIDFGNLHVKIIEEKLAYTIVLHKNNSLYGWGWRKQRFLPNNHPKQHYLNN